MAYRNSLIRSAQLRSVGRIRRGTLRGDPGLFGSIGKVLSKALPIAKVIPGVGNVLSAVSLGSTALNVGKALIKKPPAALGPVGGIPTIKLPGVAGIGKAVAIGAGGAAIGSAVTGMIQGGRTGRRYRRMNPLNHKAATRAVRRIKAVRKLCRSIESSLPKQKAACGTRGRKR